MRSARALVLGVMMLGTGACSAPPPAATLIGPEGGTLTTDDVTVTVPPGALGSPQTLSVTATDDPIPPGYVGYSRVFRFEPRGIVFAAPVSVSVRVRAGGHPQLVWTTTGETGWETRGGAVAGGFVTSTVTHFSEGFGGEPEEDAGADDGGGSDAGELADTGLTEGPDASEEDASAIDAGDVDAGASAFCPAPMLIAGGTTTNITTAGPFPPAPYLDSPDVAGPCITSTCPVGPMGAGRATYTFSLPETMQVTTWYPHALSGYSYIWRAAISGDCGTPGAACVSPMLLEYPSIVTQVLGAGTYQVDACNRAPSITFAPPPPPPTNTTCATAGVFSPARYTQPRVVTPGVTLYYAFDAPPAFDHQLVTVRSPITVGHMHISLRTDCSDPSSEIVATDTTYLVGSVPGWDTSPIVMSHPAPTYYVVISSIEPGLEYTIGLE